MERIHLQAGLDASQARFWDRANRDVLWGWKRDVGRESRVVYFSARIESEPGGPGAGICLGRYFLGYRTVLGAGPYFGPARPGWNAGRPPSLPIVTPPP